MRVQIELNEEEIRNILVAYLNNEYSLSLLGTDLHIETKSKQNSKLEWEIASIRIQQNITQKLR